MQYATCIAGNEVWEVLPFSALPDSELEQK